MSFAHRLCLVVFFHVLFIYFRGGSLLLDNPETEQRINKLLGEMTLEEKIGQLVHFADSSTGPGAPHPDLSGADCPGKCWLA
jgi:hypothetical protein